MLNTSLKAQSDVSVWAAEHLRIWFFKSPMTHCERERGVMAKERKEEGRKGDWNNRGVL